MITQDDIAKKLHISRTTVARALSGRSVSDETRRMVCEEAKRLGYVQNTAATGLALKNPKVVYAFIIATVDEGYGQQMREGIQEVANVWQGYNFQIHTIFTDISKDRNQCSVQMDVFYDTLAHNHADGVIFSALSNQNMDEANRECKKRGIPIMSLDMIYRNSQLCHIGPDYFRLGTYSAAYLASLMMQRGEILTLNYDEGYELGLRRMEGFRSKLSDYPEIVCHNMELEEISEACYNQVLDMYFSNSIPSAVYAPYHVDYIGRYLCKHNLQNKVVIISNGVNEQVELFLSDGTIRGIVSARPYFLGSVAANNFFKYFYRPTELLTGEIDVACDIYIKENYKRYDKIY